MKIRCVVIIVFAVFMLCTQKETQQVQVQNDKQPMIKVNASESWFPLSEGSFWKYVDYTAGERDASNMQTDSVISVVTNDSQIIAKTIRYFGNANSRDTIEYLIKPAGKVYKNIATRQPPEEFASINPSIGMKIGIKTYYNFCAPSADTANNCFRLEEYPYDSATTQEQKITWQFMDFKKGIGIVSFGGDEVVSKLEKYRIGNEEIRDYQE
jgi:hypothetical protein